MTKEDFTNYDKMQRSSRMRILGILAIGCGVLPLALAFFLAGLDRLVSLGIISSSQSVAIGEVIIQIIHPLLGTLIGVLLLFILQFGIKEWVDQARLGKGLFIVIVVCLIIYMVVNPIYWFLVNTPASVDPGLAGLLLLFPNASLLTSNVVQLALNPLFLGLYIITLGSALVYISAFGFLLIRLNGKCQTGNLILPAFFFLVQLITCGSLAVGGGEGEETLIVMIWLMLLGIVILVGYIFLGLRLFGWH